MAAAAPKAVQVTGPSETNKQTALIGSIIASIINQSIPTQTVTLENSIGPASILTGNRDLGGTPFLVPVGTTNLNINTHRLTDIFRTITTTQTFLTSSTWTLFGTSQATGGGTIPEPSSLALILVAFGGTGWLAWRRWWK